MHDNLILPRTLGEEDRTHEIDFDGCDDFSACLETLQQHDVNRIGIGKYRQGWHHPFNSDLVVKIAVSRDTGTVIEQCYLRNFWEFLVWCEVRDGHADLRQHLAACIDCHPQGHWLTQLKGRRPRESEYPVPIKQRVSWVGDRKQENFIRRGSRWLMVDYGTENAMEHLALPTDFDQCQRLVLERLKQRGADFKDPWYGARPK